MICMEDINKIDNTIENDIKLGELKKLLIGQSKNMRLIALDLYFNGNATTPYIFCYLSYLESNYPDDSWMEKDHSGPMDEAAEHAKEQTGTSKD